MRRVDRIAHHFSGRNALGIMTVIIIVHLIAMSFYINDNRLVEREAGRDAVLQKIVNVVHLLEATPANERAKAIAAMNDPDLQVSVSGSPRFPLKFQEVSFWEIDEALQKQGKSFAASMLLRKDQWLNINATIYTHFLLTQLAFFSVEVLIFGMIIVVAWSINRFTRPIINFKESVERLSKDLNTQPVPIDGPSVVQEAAQAMNHMQQRIQELVRNRTQMLAAISHDLRTPITRMKLRAQFVEESAAKNELIADLDEMGAMINEILFFAREDAADEAKHPLDLVSLARSVCESIADMGHHINFQCKYHRLKMLGRPLSLKRALTNLLNNATRYAKNVTVHVSRSHHRLIVAVEDDGPGIAEKELSRVFEPFYRGERSRSRDTGGVGLGLAVTKDIIKDHNGSVYLKNRAEGGLSAVVELPGDV